MSRLWSLSVGLITIELVFKMDALPPVAGPARSPVGIARVGLILPAPGVAMIRQTRLSPDHFCFHNCLDQWVTANRSCRNPVCHQVTLGLAPASIECIFSLDSHPHRPGSVLDRIQAAQARDRGWQGPR